MRRSFTSMPRGARGVRIELRIVNFVSPGLHRQIVGVSASPEPEPHPAFGTAQAGHNAVRGLPEEIDDRVVPPASHRADEIKPAHRLPVVHEGRRRRTGLPFMTSRAWSFGEVMNPGVRKRKPEVLRDDCGEDDVSHGTELDDEDPLNGSPEAASGSWSYVVRSMKSRSLPAGEGRRDALRRFPLESAFRVQRADAAQRIG